MHGRAADERRAGKCVGEDGWTGGWRATEANDHRRATGTEDCGGVTNGNDSHAWQSSAWYESFQAVLSMFGEGFQSLPPPPCLEIVEKVDDRLHLLPPSVFANCEMSCRRPVHSPSFGWPPSSAFSETISRVSLPRSPTLARSLPHPRRRASERASSRPRGRIARAPASSPLLVPKDSLLFPLSLSKPASPFQT